MGDDDVVAIREAVQDPAFCEAARLGSGMCVDVAGINRTDRS